MSSSRLRILILGGTGDARKLAQRLAESPDYAVIYSVAGTTTSPLLPDCEVRHGGFGGVEGLASFLESNSVRLLVDATHPYAAQMSSNAAKAASNAGVPLLALRRPPWSPGPDDNWQMVPDMAAAAKAIG
ncbi:MAG: precorrin-6A/cobalt-precorrin-6A reductase, partial [Pseudomonadota bacterium]